MYWLLIIMTMVIFFFICFLTFLSFKVTCQLLTAYFLQILTCNYTSCNQHCLIPTTFITYQIIWWYCYWWHRWWINKNYVIYSYEIGYLGLQTRKLLQINILISEDIWQCLLLYSNIHNQLKKFFLIGIMWLCNSSEGFTWCQIMN